MGGSESKTRSAGDIVVQKRAFLFLSVAAARAVIDVTEDAAVTMMDKALEAATA